MSELICHFMKIMEINGFQCTSFRLQHMQSVITYRTERLLSTPCQVFWISEVVLNTPLYMPSGASGAGRLKKTAFCRFFLTVGIWSANSILQ
jgi:hypothetical protein